MTQVPSLGVSPEAREEILVQLRRYGGPFANMDAFEFMTDPANHSVRSWEIIDWLKVAPKYLGVRIAAYVVLDDDDSIKSDGRTDARAVLTDSKLGLTASDADAAIDILRRPWDGAFGAATSKSSGKKKTKKRKDGKQL